MIRELSKLIVHYRERKVGTLAVAPSGNCVFQYDQEWIANGFSVSPLNRKRSVKRYLIKYIPVAKGLC